MTAVMGHSSPVWKASASIQSGGKAQTFRSAPSQPPQKRCPGWPQAARSRATPSCSARERKGVWAGTPRFWARSSLSMARASTSRSSGLVESFPSSSVLFMPPRP